jgi:3-phenylpropionate/trans-cinnamate dioxygenase ferredoxin reductase component
MIAIVGAGAAGISAAVALRELGYDRAIRILGAESTPPYDRTTLSKSFLVDQERAAVPPAILEDRLADLDLVLGTEVVDIDADARVLTTAARESVAYDQLLLTTGAQCRRLAIEGADLTGVHYLRDLADAVPLRHALAPGSRVVLVGGGVIGLEIAASARLLGCAVTVVEAAQRVMGRVVPAELSELIASEHRARGVTIRTGVPPVAFNGLSGQVTGVTLADGTAIPADSVVIGVGVAPRTELAERAGLAVADGIVVDEQFCTSRREIYAAGDAARVLHSTRRAHIRTESWYPAQDQGRLAAAAMLGKAPRYTEAPWMWSDQHDLTIQVTGFGFEGKHIVRRGAMTDRDGICFFALDNGTLAAAAGVSVGARIARTISPSRMLIEMGATVDPEALRESGRDLKRLVVGL